jgi:hypothetical protein
MRQNLGKKRVKRIALVKLLIASAIISLAIHIIYDSFCAAQYSKENISNDSISIHFESLVLSVLSGYLFTFFITFLVLLGMRFLYFYLIHHKVNMKNFR